MSSPEETVSPRTPGRPGTSTPRCLATRLAVVALAAGLLAGCGSSAASSAASPSTAATASQSPATTEVPIEPTPFPAGTRGAYGLVTEPSLLQLIHAPAGISLVESVDLESKALDDQSLAQSAVGFAAALAGDPSSDWATVSIVHLKAAADTPDYYAAWRSQYDEAACSQANGVASTDMVTIAGRSIDHATCAGEVDLYHIRLPDRHVIVSIMSIGSLGYGSQLMAGLAP